MADDDAAAPPAKSLAVIFLAAGYGTRIKKDLLADPPFSHLAHKPKPLLPIAGLSLISHWLPQISQLPSLANITLITNSVHYPLYCTWAEQIPFNHPDLTLSSVDVLSDSSKNNETRLGAVKDLEIALSHIARAAPEVENALVIAADTLLPNVDLRAQFQTWITFGSPLAVFAYTLPDMADSVRRGMLAVKGTTASGLIATALVEKPARPDLAPSSWATAPVYFFNRAIWQELTTFLSNHSHQPIEMRDAPGFLMAWLIPQQQTQILPIPERVDIGRLQHYKSALYQYTLPALPRPQKRLVEEPAVGRAFPRIGLLGNPSDMYGGRVVAVAIQSEGFAEVIATPAESFSVDFNAQHELPPTFTHYADFVNSIETRGVHYGARPLVLSAALAFSKKYANAMHPKKQFRDAVADLPNCSLSYSTTIPPRIGLSGSSALILATWRALARFFNTSLEQIDNDQSVWPVLLRSVEMDDLGITCGLMDRVVQIMQGCVEMDFTKGMPGLWTWLPDHILPDLFLIYHNDAVGECSGAVHAGAKKRINPDDVGVQNVVSELAKCAETGAKLLRQKDNDPSTGLSELATLFERNFELRCSLIGRKAVGKNNELLIDVARQAGFAAKMTGSGGCVVCIPNPVRTLTTTEECKARDEVESHGMVLRKVQTLKRLEWRS